MAAEQQGTGGLTVGGTITAFETMLTRPADSIIEGVTIVPGGSPEQEDQMDSDGVFHTRLVFERGMDTINAVVVGKDYVVGGSGQMDGTTFLESVSKEYGKAALRVTIAGTKLPTATP